MFHYYINLYFSTVNSTIQKKIKNVAINSLSPKDAICVFHKLMAPAVHPFNFQ